MIDPAEDLGRTATAAPQPEDFLGRELPIRVYLPATDPSSTSVRGHGRAARNGGELIREIMLDPGKLRGCIDTGGRLDDRIIARELARIAGEIRALEEERWRLIGRYAAEQMAGEAYITANRALDADLERLTREKAELVAALRSPQHDDFVDASVRQFCASARARLQEWADFDLKREFLLGHIERVIYNRYKVMIVGPVPVQSVSGETKLQFLIRGEIHQKAVRSRPRSIRPEDGGWKATPERDVAAPSPAEKFGLVGPL